MYKYFKAIFDRLMAFIGLICLFPFFIVIGIMIKLDSKGPVIFKHKRLGKNCEPIYVWKFRTMVENAINVGPEWTDTNDSRITKVGKVLRNTSTDELPQIINILKGDMSIIGPRPDAYTEEPTSRQIERTKVLPGLTGLAQVNGRSSITREKKEEYDIEYVEKLSFSMDMSIFIKTIKLVLNRKGVN